MDGALTVDAFRKGEHLRRSSRSKITRSEWTMLAAATPAVVVSPFMIGGMPWWSQVTIAILQVLVFIAALIPFSGFAEWRKRMVKIAKFPPFWLGAIFIIYVMIQALNPSIKQVYMDETKFFIADLKPEYYKSWLPQSVLSNFYLMNPWRMVVFWTGAWALVCGLWMSLDSRKAWLALGWLALGTGGLVSLASIAHHISDNQQLFWLENFKRNDGAFGPFVYRNQAAAYMYLCMGLGFAIFLHLLRRGGSDSGIHWLALILSFACMLGIILCPSRGGWIGGACVVLFFLLLLPFAMPWRNGISKSAVLISGIILAGVVGIGFWVVKNMDFSEINEKWEKLQTNESASLNARITVSQITWDMFEERPWIGWGGGSFYYRYPLYALSYPELYFRGDTNWKHYGKSRLRFRQAHNDIFQFLAEYGIIGVSFMALCLAYWLLVPVIQWCVSMEWLMASAVFIIFFLHNFFEFFLQNSIDLNMSLILLVCCTGCCLASKQKRGASDSKTGKAKTQAG